MNVVTDIKLSTLKWLPKEIKKKKENNCFPPRPPKRTISPLVNKCRTNPLRPSTDWSASISGFSSERVYLPGTFINVWKHLRLSRWGGRRGGHWDLQVGARDAAGALTMQGTPPTTKNYLARDVTSIQVEDPRTKWTGAAGERGKKVLKVEANKKSTVPNTAGKGQEWESRRLAPVSPLEQSLNQLHLRCLWWEWDRFYFGNDGEEQLFVPPEADNTALLSLSSDAFLSQTVISDKKRPRQPREWLRLLDDKTGFL